MPNQDDLSKFKQIIAKLPEEKRKLLYKRLHSLPPSEREAYISEFVKRFYTPEKKEAPKKNPAQSIILGLIVALFVVGVLYFVYVFNKETLDGKFNEAFGLPTEDTIDITPETSDIAGPEPRHFPTDTPTPVPATPTPAPIKLKEDHPDLSGMVIVIDPGHQAEYDHELEEAIPGTSAEKERATPGAVGVVSGAKEYEITLHYALIMKEYLEGCGAEVILTRTENEVDISNFERALIAVDNNADYFIRLHADSAPDSDISGVKVYVPSTGKYKSSASSDGTALAEKVAEAIGSTSLGSVQSNMYTGLNHADSIRSYQLVIGYLSNSADDALLGKEGTAYNVAVAVSEFLGQ